MDQRIAFVETAQGRIAYATAGRGPALLVDMGWVSHLSHLWQAPAYRRFFELLARDHLLVMYDKAGTGLSDRSRTDFAPEADVTAVEAVVARLELDRLALFGSSQGGAVGVRFADRHPELVERLVLYGAFARGDRLGTPDMQASLIALTRAHWGLGSTAMTELFIPGADRVTHDWFSRAQRVAADAATAARLLEAMFTIDVTDELGRLRCPVLVVHRQGDRAIPFERGRELAALVPGAVFEPLAGREHLPYMGDSGALARAVVAFLGGARPAGPAALTRRELEIAELVAEGLTNPEIARRLSLAPRTVDAHLEHIRNKLGVRSRTQVGVWAAGARSR